MAERICPQPQSCPTLFLAEGGMRGRSISGWSTRNSPSRMTVMALGRKPSPPGHRVLYSAARERGACEGLGDGAFGQSSGEAGEGRSPRKGSRVGLTSL